MSERRTLRRAAISLAAVALLVVLVRRGCARVEEPAPASTPPSTTSNGAAPTVATAAVPTTTIAPPAPSVLARMNSVAQLEQVLADYKANAVYPTWSRPHDEGTVYKLEWNKPIVSDLPFNDQSGRKTNYRFAADRAHVVFGESITSWIEVWEGDDDTKRIPVKIHGAWVIAVSGPKPGRMIELSYRDDGLEGDVKAGDLRYSNRFTPSEVKELATARHVHILADIEVDKVRKPIMRDFTYAPRALAKVVGMSDGIKDGNLVVTVALQVFEKGTYSLEANVMSGDGATPIGYVSMGQPLEPGLASVALPFFGKIFHTKGIDGPYLIKDVRGYKYGEGGEENAWFSHEGTLLTKPYKTVDFSPAEWDAPEKREKIAGMTQLIADTKAGKVGGPLPPGQQAKTIVIDVDKPSNDPPAN